MSADATPSPQSPECSTVSAVTVDAIFARAERVFERRVDQILHAKRQKAACSGASFNARKAKRDARTVAGREKLDALVRRLADLATVQQMLLGKSATALVTNVLDGATAAALGVAALHAKPAPQPPQPPQPTVPSEPPVVKEEKELIETSSCSDGSVGAVAKDDMREFDDDHKPLRMYHATQSVVNFVLDSDDEHDAVPTVCQVQDVARSVPATRHIAKLRRMNSAPAQAHVCHSERCDCVCDLNYACKPPASSTASRARPARGHLRAQPQSLPLSALKCYPHYDMSR
eukprot:TRINITY_DN242_c0_g3_i1.p1 TRINITY_DN242_c0_g3~~TRINITY_DN242_c0_g3_i1.p1  ORF type:complete len:288 (+),score=67.34 TRINITY_DN242_c0_g3_i1:186-1049(+)